VLASLGHPLSGAALKLAGAFDFLFALGRGDDGLRDRGGGRRAHRRALIGTLLRLGLPAAGVEDRDGGRSVSDRVWFLAALLSRQRSRSSGRSPHLDEAVKLALQRNSDLQRQILLSLSASRTHHRPLRHPPPPRFQRVDRRNRQGGHRGGFGRAFPQPSSNYSTTTRAHLSQLIFDGGKWWKQHLRRESRARRQRGAGR